LPFDKWRQRVLQNYTKATYSSLQDYLKLGFLLIDQDNMSEVNDALVTEINQRFWERLGGPQFQVGNRVRVVKKVPYWNLATNLEPPIGLLGKVTTPNISVQEAKDPFESAGFVGVNVSTRSLGGNHYNNARTTIWIPCWALELAPRYRGTKAPS
jgi:hypothetical protein